MRTTDLRDARGDDVRVAGGHVHGGHVHGGEDGPIAPAAAPGAG